ncbi:MAG TPA: dihydroxyacetone kinase family protein [Propionibacteriaceae bacterium]|nr:dihydroxyacetone kinase family protein [Propionibacteriaceae bacterium]
MKKLINEPAVVVPDMLAGLVLLNPALALLRDGLVVHRADAREPAALDSVALISGGGSGHEPAHGGYVGPGMLSAAVAGEVFISPSTDAVLAAVRLVAGPRGVLLIVKNYTGDRLNFALAAEIARSEGIDVEMVVVADDVALSADGPHAGRRGLAGTVLVHKVAGAAAAEGRSLAEVAAAARSAAASLGTMGVALSPCTVPAAGQPGFSLADDEVEWGLGIHGEPGVRRGALVRAGELVNELLTPVIGDLRLGAGSRVALLVNNLGGSAAGELSIVASAAVAQLRARQIVVERAWAGTFLTALEMAGCSISVLEVDDERLRRLDAPTRTSAWPSHLGRVQDAVPEVALPEPPAPRGPALAADSTLRRVVEAVCDRLQAAEPRLTELDQQVGDGDLGDSLARAARGITAELDGYPADSPAALLRAMSATVRRVVGGTSGPMYAIALLRAAIALDVESPGAVDWSRAFTAGVAGVRELGGATIGDRTMVDALQPAAEAFARHLDESDDVVAALATALQRAEAGAAETARLTPRLGRSSYVGERALGVPDPGAVAVTLWLAAVRDALTEPGPRR